MKIGIYGGTFDPIHHAHLILAREAMESLQLEGVIFVPAAASPHKQDRHIATASVRLKMLRAAITEEPKFSVDDCELRRGAPSYTIDTIEEIMEREKGAKIFYFIGEDNVPGLRTWHRFAELEKLVEFIVLDRTGLETKHSFQIIARKIDISATEIRNRVASGRSIRYLVPEAVDRIIQREQLYRKPKI
ncbi:MAG: nicotinate-nucleotide adenylyltransferase [Verrucomicrobiota bacterium]